MSTVDSPKRPSFLAVLLLAAVALAAAQEPTVMRVSDAVGDTIDRAERDSFHLFPNTAGFQYATILELPKPEIMADVTFADEDSSRHVFFRLVPSQLERIRFLVDNRDLVRTQLISDASAASTLATFWQSIEDQQWKNTAGDLAGISNAATALPEVDTAGSALARPSANYENRLTCAALGATLGSVAGGCVGAYTGYTLVTSGHFEETECCAFYVPPLYRVDLPIVLGTSIGATAAAGVIGYAFGAAEDRKPSPARLEDEKSEWRAGCAGAGAFPAIALGILTGVAVRGTIFGRERDWTYNIENDPDGWSALPAVLTGICVSIEVVAISYQIGRTIDRQKAEEAEARNRALGR
jgi:hypothetical protein